MSTNSRFNRFRSYRKESKKFKLAVTGVSLRYFKTLFEVLELSGSLGEIVYLERLLRNEETRAWSRDYAQLESRLKSLREKEEVVYDLLCLKKRDLDEKEVAFNRLLEKSWYPILNSQRVFEIGHRFSPIQVILEVNYEVSDILEMVLGVIGYRKKEDRRVLQYASLNSSLRVDESEVVPYFQVECIWDIDEDREPDVDDEDDGLYEYTESLVLYETQDIPWREMWKMMGY